MNIFLICLLGIVFLAIVSLLFQPRLSDASVPKIAPYLPFIGHLWYFIKHRKNFSEVSRDLIENQTGYERGYQAVYPDVGISYFAVDVDTVQHILADIVTYSVPKNRNKKMGEIFGQGIFMSNGANWKIQRDLSKPMFLQESRSEMFKEYLFCADRLFKKLDSTTNTDTAIDVQRLFKKYTLDTFSLIAFGVDTNSLTNPIPFSNSFDWILQEADRRSKDPTRKYWNQPEWKRHVKIFGDFVLYIINQRRKADDWREKSDYLSLLFAAEDENKESMTNEFIKDQIANFLIAGRDTTAMLISWTFYFLSKHPQVEELLINEVNTVYGEECKPDIKKIKSLKYMQFVLDEVLRLRPPAVPVSSKLVTQDDILPNGVKLRKGEHVIFQPPVLQTLTKYWGNDALEFKPERWQDQNKINRKAFIPFRAGERICLGMTMAYEEAKCVLSLLLHKGYRFRQDTVKHEETIYPTSISQFAEGMFMKVTNEALPQASS